MPYDPRAFLEADAAKGLRLAVESDCNAVAAILAAAFQNDPIMLWTFVKPEGVRRAMRVFFLSVYLRQGLVLIEKNGLAVSLWLLPGRRRTLSVLAGLHYAAALAPVAGLLPIFRGARFADALAKAHRARPALYLFALGVRPEAQKRGLGSTMIGSGLQFASDLGVAVDLETSKPANIAYYERHGFRVRAKIQVGVGALRVWSMEALPG